MERVTHIDNVAVARPLGLEEDISLVARFTVLHPLDESGSIVGGRSFNSNRLSFYSLKDLYSSPPDNKLTYSAALVSTGHKHWVDTETGMDGGNGRAPCRLEALDLGCFQDHLDH
jgi:hypothetical protein